MTSSTPETFDSLAGKLDAFDENLSNEERALMLVLFKLAAESLEAGTEAEVEGHAFAAVSLSAGFRKSFFTKGSWVSLNPQPLPPGPDDRPVGRQLRAR